MRFNVIKTYCKCHPETCACNPWALVDASGNTPAGIPRFYDKADAQALADKLNKFKVVHPDDAVVMDMAEAMKSKLEVTRDKGRKGWQTASAAALWAALIEQTQRIDRDPVDVANYAMMIWYLTNKE